MTDAKLLTIQVGQPRQMTDEGWPELRTGPWTSAIIKEPVLRPVWLSRTNLEGDAQGNPAVHGGPDKAALAYSAAHYSLWRAELGRDLPYGAFGENLTIEGQDENAVCIGDTYAIGDDVIVEVASPRAPCWKIARRWQIKDLTARVEATGRTGWYLRVLREGQLEPGQRITLIDRPNPGWSVTRATETMANRRRDMTAANQLAQLAALAESWKQQLLTPASA